VLLFVRVFVSWEMGGVNEGKSQVSNSCGVWGQPGVSIEGDTATE
jgi:hypothetical protein